MANWLSVVRTAYTSTSGRSFVCKTLRGVKANIWRARTPDLAVRPDSTRFWRDSGGSRGARANNDTARALSLVRATFAGRLAGSRGRQGEDGRGQRWHATSMDSREFPQVGIGDGCVLSTKSLERATCGSQMATVVTPGQQCLGAKCESGSLRGAEAITSCPNVMAALRLSTLRSGLIFKRRWITCWQACRAQRPTTTTGALGTGGRTTFAAGRRNPETSTTRSGGRSARRVRDRLEIIDT